MTHKHLTLVSCILCHVLIHEGLPHNVVTSVVKSKHKATAPCNSSNKPSLAIIISISFHIANLVNG